MSASRADHLTALALAGMAHSPGAPLTTGAPVDGIPLPGEDAGRDLLLRAGALATYRAAGRLPMRGVAPLEPAPAERHPLCPPEAAALIEGLFITHNHALLPEAFARVQQAGCLLPPSLLPLALDTVQRDSRPALTPLIGERGHWLARFNPAWKWAAETLAGADDTLPRDAETVWQEGATAQRVALLARLRASDPARAREWLAGVWKREKAETRASMLETFTASLSMEDEPLLDAALDDRSERVRAVAARLLTALPGSALALRIRDRADAALTFDGATLDATPPKEVDADWARDGLSTQTNIGKQGQRSDWLGQLMKRVPPSHWEMRFEMSPAELIAATADSPWRADILGHWTDAAVAFRDIDWINPLWDTWLALEGGKYASESCRVIAPVAAPDRLEALALRLIADPGAYNGIELYEALDLLPRPWSHTTARAYLEGLRAFVDALAPNAHSATPWDVTLDIAARAMPESAFAAAREPIAITEPKHWQVTQFKKQLDAFAETIRLRERLVKVLPL